MRLISGAVLDIIWDPGGNRTCWRETWTTDKHGFLQQQCYHCQSTRWPCPNAECWWLTLMMTPALSIAASPCGTPSHAPTTTILLQILSAFMPTSIGGNNSHEFSYYIPLVKRTIKEVYLLKDQESWGQLCRFLSWGVARGLPRQS